MTIKHWLTWESEKRWLRSKRSSIGQEYEKILEVMWPDVNLAVNQMFIAKESTPDEETGPGLSCAKMQLAESI
jgi:hypothetical protein